jgi:hypothetical protein
MKLVGLLSAKGQLIRLFSENSILNAAYPYQVILAKNLPLLLYFATDFI